MTDFNTIKTYYAHFDEWSRLDSPAGKLELYQTLRNIEETLEPRSRVLDLGGGPGRYTLALAERDHEVSLGELSAELLAEAKKRVALSPYRANVKSMLQTNAIDLSQYESASFDAVLALGPFYHLTTTQEREMAVSEIRRVLSTGGTVFASFIPKWSGLAGLVWRDAHRPGQVTAESFREAFSEGVFRNPTESGFQEGYYFMPQEIKCLFGSRGFEHIRTSALQGFAANMEQELYRVEEEDSDLFSAIMASLVESSRHDSVLEFGGHCLYVGRKA